MQSRSLKDPGKRGILDRVCGSSQTLCYVLFTHTQDMSGQAAHDSAWAEFAALNVSINAQHILSANLIYRTSGLGWSHFPHRPLLTPGYA